MSDQEKETPTHKLILELHRASKAAGLGWLKECALRMSDLSTHRKQVIREIIEESQRGPASGKKGKK